MNSIDNNIRTTEISYKYDRQMLYLYDIILAGGKYASKQ